MMDHQGNLLGVADVVDGRGFEDDQVGLVARTDAEGPAKERPGLGRRGIDF